MDGTVGIDAMVAVCDAPLSDAATGLSDGASTFCGACTDTSTAASTAPVAAVSAAGPMRSRGPLPTPLLVLHAPPAPKLLL